MNTMLPKVQILATGGTISGVGRHRLDYVAYGETGQHLTIQELLARVPEVTQVARVEAEQFANVGSPALTPQHWLELAQRINQGFRSDPDLSGVVVTHGTATMEETGYFLNLTVKDPRPVVLTGAMRPASALGTDADVNLLAAVRTAASPSAINQGVMVVLNDQISAAREVSKTNTYRVETFKPGELGLLGYADSDGAVVFYRSPTRRHTHQSAFQVDENTSLPRVDVNLRVPGGRWLAGALPGRTRSWRDCHRQRGRW
ncbi:MAG: asparaginase [Dehalococcoidia bacterium]